MTRSTTISLRERLAQLSLREARDLLGPQGFYLLRECRIPDDFDPRTDVYVDSNVFQLTLRDDDPMLPVLDGRIGEEVVVSLSLDTVPRDKPGGKRKSRRNPHSAIRCHCSACSTPEREQVGCPHVATALSLILDEKPLLGLSDPPDRETPLEHLSEEQLLERAVFERRARAESEPFQLLRSGEVRLDAFVDAFVEKIVNDTIENDAIEEGHVGSERNVHHDAHDDARQNPHAAAPPTPHSPWADYRVLSGTSGQLYRVALRGEQRGSSYCDCPDFRTNTLGTCKHIEFALNTLRKQFPRSAFREPYRNDAIFVHVRYGEERTLHLVLPDAPTSALLAATKKYLDRPIDDVRGLVKLVARLERAGFPVTIYPDAEELISRALFRLSITEKADAIRNNPKDHPLRTTLLKEELYPYQLDGIAFAVGAGRAILADDIGLGKTVQGIGVAELLARYADIRTVLVVCSRIRKSHWKSEIHRFSNRKCTVAREGRHEERPRGGHCGQNNGQYRGETIDEPVVETESPTPPPVYGSAFFTVCTYERLVEDVEAIRRVHWDLVILDDGERLCDWQSKTARAIKRLVSPFALLLTDSLPKNNPADLYSMVQFVDDRRLPPAFRFFHRHREVDSRGKPVAYKDLTSLRKAVEPILLRRTRAAVWKELPARSTRIVTIPQSPEQARIHAEEISRARRRLAHPRLTEIEMVRIRKHLLTAQRVCDGAQLVHKTSGEPSAKLEYLDRLLRNSLADENSRIVVFSEWPSMLVKIAEKIDRDGVSLILADPGAPLKKRREAVKAFCEERKTDGKTGGGKAGCRILLTTGDAVRDISLGGADTLIHFDLPWTPAALERRIAVVEQGRRNRKTPIRMFLFIAENSIEERLLHQSRDAAASVFDCSAGIDTFPLEEETELFRQRLFTLLGAEPSREKSEPAGVQHSVSATVPLVAFLETTVDGKRRLVVELPD